MNCKPGMAVMVKRSLAGNEGRVGTVSQWTGSGLALWPGWLVIGRFKDGLGFECESGVFPDEWLIPLPGGEGADETLTWKDVPAPIKTKEIA